MTQATINPSVSLTHIGDFSSNMPEPPASWRCVRLSTLQAEDQRVRLVSGMLSQQVQIAATACRL
jgi:hypothetical protein